MTFDPFNGFDPFGGGAVAFDPLSLAPSQWLSDTGSSPGTWPDLSGNGWDATQETVANQPRIVSAALNGRQVRDFDGTNDFLAHLLTVSSSDNAVFAVVRNDSLTSSIGPIYGASASLTVLKCYLAAQWTASSQWGTYRNGAFVSSGSTVRGSFSVVGLLASASGGVFRHNGIATTHTQSAFYAGDGSDRRKVGSSSPGELFKGRIAEIMVFSRLVAVGECQAVERYLGAKYRISVA